MDQTGLSRPVQSLLKRLNVEAKEASKTKLIFSPGEPSLNFFLYRTFYGSEMSQQNTCISSSVSIFSASVSKSATPYCYDTATNPIALIHLTAPKTCCADASLFCPHRKKVESRLRTYNTELTAPAKYGNTPTPVPLAAVKPEGWGGGKKKWDRRSSLSPLFLVGCVRVRRREGKVRIAATATV